VLRHWLAADDADRALPHAVHQLYATSAAGLSATRSELQLLELLERASDCVLPDNLWLSAEINSNLNPVAHLAGTWQRLYALRQKVQSLQAPSASAVWIAFETARIRFYFEKSAKVAYEVLVSAVNLAPQQGVELARTEHSLALYAFQLTGNPRDHLQRAQNALRELPERLSRMRVRAMIDVVAAIWFDPVEGIRSQPLRWRAGQLLRHRAAALGPGAQQRLQAGHVSRITFFQRLLRQLDHEQRVAPSALEQLRRQR
jgi:hypothetical protein